MNAPFRPAPSLGSYRAEPLSPDEIDAHPDCDRIWATVQAECTKVETAYAENEGKASDVLDEIAEELCGFEERTAEVKDSLKGAIAEIERLERTANEVDILLGGDL